MSGTPSSPPPSRQPGRLQESLSGYLKQHADNPVDWHPWGEDAIALAKKENKPIFLSIGFSTCYWCHVMEEDVFSNEDIARKMNEWFINIKVDKEERPEVDEIYMTARGLITHQSGWPNNLFLTPDLKPFHAAGLMTSDGRFGQTPFPELIEKAHMAWENDRQKVLSVAEETADEIHKLLAPAAHEVAPQTLDMQLPSRLLAFLKEHHDKEFGGFFDAPKFPNEPYLSFLLSCYRRQNDSDALEMARHSLDALASSAMYDALGGGFHRYASDRGWNIPHFEKMLYRQALMAKCYTHLYRITQSPWHKYLSEHTLDYILSGMAAEHGGFCAALDAETDGVEGAYYAWDENEIRATLSQEDADFFFTCFSLEIFPVIPGHKAVADGRMILSSNREFRRIFEKNDSSDTKEKQRLENILNELRSRRQLRKRPYLDDKIVTGWNGLTIDALALAGSIFSAPAYIERAEKTARFILSNIRLENGILARMWSEGRAHHRAYLEDYSFFIAGLLSLHRSTGAKEWLSEAEELAKQADSLFLDPEFGTYYFTDGKDRMITRIRKASDSALPSCTGLMASNMLDLHEFTGDSSWLERAQKKLLAYSGAMRENPAEYASMLQALLRMQEEGQLP